MPADGMELQGNVQPHEIRAIATDAIAKGLFWLPGLASLLATLEWAALARHSGISPDTYGTDRLRASDRHAPRHVLATVTVPRSAGALRRPIMVEHPFASERHYRTLDLSFYEANELSASFVKERLSNALQCLSAAPDMATAISHLVRTIHVLRPPGPAYDVSHSDPGVPFSIFVSLPTEKTDAARLRLAEAILHETMHLQLTLLECHAPLVARPEAVYYSPWKRSNRPIQGIMHGLYVFGVVDAFLGAIEDLPDFPAATYARNRRSEIADEIAYVRAIGLTEDLTEFGARLRAAVLARFT